jgi:hypothetical protein
LTSATLIRERVLFRVSDQSPDIAQFHDLPTNITVFVNTPTYWPIRHKFSRAVHTTG